MKKKQDNDKTRLSKPTVFLATWFGVGFLPNAPGTWGSLASLPFAWLLHLNTGWEILAVAGLGLFIIGVWAADGYINLFGGEDPRPVVIDEVAGMWLTLTPAAYFYPNSPDFVIYFIAFFLFRLADISKPWPASLADKKIKGGFGVMVDDLIAAVFSGLGLTFYIVFIGA